MEKVTLLQANTKLKKTTFWRLLSFLSTNGLVTTKIFQKSQLLKMKYWTLENITLRIEFTLSQKYLILISQMKKKERFLKSLSYREVFLLATWWHSLLKVRLLGTRLKMISSKNSSNLGKPFMNAEKHTCFRSQKETMKFL